MATSLERRVFLCMRTYFDSTKEREERLEALKEVEALVKAPQKKAGSRMTIDWVLPDEDGDWAIAAGLSADKIFQIWPQFRDHHISKGTISKDWSASWRTWVRNVVEKGW